VELLGYPKEEIIGKNWFMNFLPEEIRSETKKYFKKILRGESSIDDYYENPVITKYGVKILWWQNTLLNNSKEEIFCVLLSAEDITERKKTDIETQSEMTYLSHLVEIAPVGIVVTDNFGKVLRVNSEFVHMFGYEAERGRWTKYRHPGGPPRCPEGSQSYHRVCPSGREGFFGNGTAQEGRHSH
jgi:PAS domain S-box-containing protein